MRLFSYFLLPWLLSIISCSTALKGTTEVNNRPKPQTMGETISLRVLWTVSEYRLSLNAVWNEEEARKLLFKPLDMGAHSITFDGKKCEKIVFNKETVKTKEYLRDFFHTTPQALDIKDETFEIIKTNCNLPGFGEYLRLKDGRLIIRLNGVFFYFEPNINF